MLRSTIPFSFCLALSLTPLVGCGDDGDGGTETTTTLDPSTSTSSGTSTSASTTSGDAASTTTAATEDSTTADTDAASDSGTATETDTEDLTDTDGGDTGTGGDVDTDTDTDAATGGPDTGEIPAELSDAEILHVLTVANAGEIEAAQLAETRASDEAVTLYATAMITDHTSAQGEVDALAESLGLTPEASLVSGTLSEAATLALALLEDTEDAEFDAIYMESQVAMHAQVLVLIEGMLEGADADELITLLESLQTVVQGHHDHAVTILADLD